MGSEEYYRLWRRSGQCYDRRAVGWIDECQLPGSFPISEGTVPAGDRRVRRDVYQRQCIIGEGRRGGKQGDERVEGRIAERSAGDTGGCIVEGGARITRAYHRWICVAGCDSQHLWTK